MVLLLWEMEKVMGKAMGKVMGKVMEKVMEKVKEMVMVVKGLEQVMELGLNKDLMEWKQASITV